MTAEGVKVDAQGIKRNGKVRSALGAVADEYRTRLLSNESRDLSDRIDRSQRVRDVIKGDNFRSLVEQTAQKIEIDLSIGR